MSWDETVAEGAGGQEGHLPPSLARRYVVMSLLGRGGMGVVFKARERSLARPVALKLLLGGFDSTRLARFRREGKLAAGLSHPGIVRVHDAGVAEGVPFIAYELVEGARPLGELFEELTRRERLLLLRDAARALGHAHRRGVVHRDVKPDNLLVDAGGRLRVADFGLARRIDGERLTQTGTLLGTPTHMAPEQVRGGEAALSPAADVWALGVILFRALTGRHPWGDAATPIEFLARAAAGPVPEARALDASVPAELDALCRRALLRDPAQRLPDGDAFADALEAALEAKPPRPARWAFVLLALAGLVALGAGGVMWLGPRPAGSPGRDDSAGTGVEPTPAAEPAASASPARELAPPPPVPAELQRLARDLLYDLRALEDPTLRLRAAESWLARFGDHPAAEEVRALRAADRRAGPVAIIDHSRGRVPTRGVFLSGERLLSYGGGGRARLWSLREPEPRELCSWGPFPGGIVAAGPLPGDAGALLKPLGLPLRRVRPDGDLQVIAGTRYGEALAVSPAGDLFALGDGGRVELHALSGVDPVRVLEHGSLDILALAFTPDGKHLVAAGKDGRGSGGGVVFSLADERHVRSLACLTPILSMSVHPAGRQLAIGARSGAIVLFDLLEEGPGALFGQGAAQSLGLHFHHPSVLEGLCYAPDGRRLYSISRSATHAAHNELAAWEATGEELWRSSRGRQLRSVELAPSGRWLCLGTNAGELELWSLGSVR